MAVFFDLICPNDKFNKMYKSYLHKNTDKITEYQMNYESKSAENQNKVFFQNYSDFRIKNKLIVI